MIVQSLLLPEPTHPRGSWHWVSHSLLPNPSKSLPCLQMPRLPPPDPFLWGQWSPLLSLPSCLWARCYSGAFWFLLPPPQESGPLSIYNQTLHLPIPIPMF